MFSLCCEPTSNLHSNLRFDRWNRKYDNLIQCVPVFVSFSFAFVNVVSFGVYQRAAREKKCEQMNKKINAPPLNRLARAFQFTE